MFFQNFLKFPMNLPAVGFPRRAEQARWPHTTTYRSLLGDKAWERLDPAIRDRFGALFMEYYLRLKHAELDRYRKYCDDSGIGADNADVTGWEQDEYYDFF